MAMTGAKSEALAGALADAGVRFIAAFPGKCDAAQRLIDAGPGQAGRGAALEALAHKLAGLAGMAGFPSVAAAATALEALAATLDADTAAENRARDTLERLRAAFVRDLSVEANRAPASPAARDRATVLVVEDDDDQRALIAGYLTEAGYGCVTARSTEEALEALRSARPAVMLVDVRLPGEDGFTFCQHVKADPALARIPVLFVTARDRVDERTAGLALGADDYLVKPVDMRELAIRVHRACARAWGGEPAGGAAVIPYAEFFERARTWLQRAGGTVVFLRTPPQHLSAVQATIRREVRTRDLVGAYDAGNLVLLLPEMPASVALDRLANVITRLRDSGIAPVTAGIAAAPSAGGSIMSLMRDAHEALIEARYLGEPVALSGVPRPPAPDRAPRGMTVLLVDDDPDVARIIDTQIRAAGHGCTLAFDGEQALAAIDRTRPDVVLLDLMMPKLGGFEVLARLNELEGPRPAVVVISARGREADVTRAFDLGASDYVTKPFSPQELMARVSRLAR
jgi:DNA-binding response OmpR family regulator